MKRRVNETDARFDGKRRSGAAAAELAILLPFVVLMFGVTLDFCRIFHASQTIQNCAYAAALYASDTAEARPEFSDSEEAAADAAVAEGASLKPPVTVADVTTTYSNDQVTVTVTYQFSMLTPILGSTTRTIKRSVTMSMAP